MTHPKDASEYAPEACEACAGSFGPCYESQVMRRKEDELRDASFTLALVEEISQTRN